MIDQKGRELGRLIGQSSEYQALKRSNESLSEDRDAVTLQVSLEHGLLSSHMTSFRQQPAMGSFLHLWVAVSQVSAVHRFTSTQSPSETQQFATAVYPQVPEVVLQASVVQGSLSLHCASPVQHPALGVTSHL